MSDNKRYDALFNGEHLRKAYRNFASKYPEVNTKQLLEFLLAQNLQDYIEKPPEPTPLPFVFSDNPLVQEYCAENQMMYRDQSYTVALEKFAEWIQNKSKLPPADFSKMDEMAERFQDKLPSLAKALRDPDVREKVAGIKQFSEVLDAYFHGVETGDFEIDSPEFLQRIKQLIPALQPDFKTLAKNGMYDYADAAELIINYLKYSNNNTDQ